jgi:hypothetical protein
MLNVTIFISSVTNNEVGIFREQIKSALEYSGKKATVRCKIQEYFGDNTIPTIEKLYEYISTASLVVQFLGQSYGEPVPKDALTQLIEKEKLETIWGDKNLPCFRSNSFTYTQMEGFFAICLDKPLLLLEKSSANGNERPEDDSYRTILKSDKDRHVQQYNVLHDAIIKIQQELYNTPSLSDSFLSRCASMADQFINFDPHDSFVDHRENIYRQAAVLNKASEWLDSTDTKRILAISAIPGWGKSYFSSQLAKENPKAIMKHFIRFNDPHTFDISSILMSFIGQLMSRSANFCNHVIESQKSFKLPPDGYFEGMERDLCLHGLADPIRKCLENGSLHGPLVFLIDGLDEAVDPDPAVSKSVVTDFANELLANILIKILPKKVKFILTYRQGAEVSTLIKSLGAELIELADWTDSQELATYASRRMKRPIRHLASEFVENARGSFRFLTYIIDIANEPGFTEDDAVSFKSLEGSINLLYRDDFKARIFPVTESDGSNAYYEFQIKPMLEILVAEPTLTLDEVVNILSSAKSLRETTRLESYFKRIRYNYYSVRKNIHLSHYTFREWIVSEGAGRYQVSLVNGSRRITQFLQNKYGNLLDLVFGSKNPTIFSRVLTPDLIRWWRHFILCGEWAMAINVLAIMSDGPFMPVAKNIPKRMQLVALFLQHLRGKLELTGPEYDNFADQMRPVQWTRLFDIIRSVYATSDLQVALRVLLRFCGAMEVKTKKEEILKAVLDEDDYVLRFNVARALVYEGDSKRAVSDAVKRLQSNAADQKELGAYMFVEAAFRDPSLLAKRTDALDLLTSREACYSLPSAFGDLVLRLAWCKDPIDIVIPAAYTRNEWPHIQKDVVVLRAIGRMSDGYKIDFEEDPVDWVEVDSERDWLLEMEKHRDELCSDKSGLPNRLKLALHHSRRTREALSYSDDADNVEGSSISALDEISQYATEKSAEIEQCFRILLGHPVWTESEEGSSLLHALMHDSETRKLAVDLIRQFLSEANPKQWRVRYGAAEAAFLCRHFDPGPFEEALADESMYNHDRSFVRANLAENFTADLLERDADDWSERLKDFSRAISRWLVDRDCWVLEQVFRLYREIHKNNEEGSQDAKHTAGKIWENARRSAPGEGILQRFGSENWWEWDRDYFLQKLEKVGPNRQDRSVAD